MAEKRQCMYCENQINKLNKTGYCSACFKANVNGIQSEYQKKYKTGSTERKVCANEGCETKLRTDNKNGYCNPCFKSNKDGCRTIAERNRRTGSEDWQDKRCENPDCQVVLKSNNTRGVCSKCYNSNYNFIKTKHEKAKTLGYLPDVVNICKGNGCEKVLYENNDIGYCRECSIKEGVFKLYQRVRLTGTADRSSCHGCEVEISFQNKTGYCVTCYKNNVDGIRSKADSSPRRLYKKRIASWNRQGIIFTEDDVIEYEEAAQCQICDKEFADNRQSMKCLDHDHETGHYRGTICGACNTGLGKLGDNLPEILEKVFHYYAQYSKQQGHQPKVNLIR